MRKYINGYLNLDKVVLLYVDDLFGTLRMESFPAEYVSYIRKSDVGADYKKIVDIHQRRGNIGQPVDDGDWVRLTWNNRYRRDEECSKKGYFIEKNIPTYEADLHPVRRLFADRGLQVGRPRRIYLDLETDSRVPFDKAIAGDARILSWALVDETGKIRWAVIEDETDDEERRILNALFLHLDDYDQIVTWNGDGFDEPVLRARVKRLRMQLDFRRWLFLDHMKAFKRYNTGSAESGEEKQSFSLENIAQAVLGTGKHDLSLNEKKHLASVLGMSEVLNKSMAALSWHMWKAGGEYRKKLVDYNIQDTDLLRRIEEETGYLELFQTICEVCNVFPESRSMQPTVQVDGFLMRLGVEKNHHFITKYYQEEGAEFERFQGAYVMDPLCTGTLKNVHVGDFASLYPSIMITFNISPETKREEASPTTLKVPATGVYFDTAKQGLLPMALETLLALRKEWSKKQASFPPGTPESKDAGRRSIAYKVAANAFYGVMGSPYSRYFDKEIAESTTLSGAWLIHTTMDEAVAHGMEKIYGDTDSLFIRGATETQFRTFVNHCNDNLYPQLLKDAGCTTNRISLAYEKEFERLVFPITKEGKPAAKRYVGTYAHYKGKKAVENSKPEVKGLEYKRGDGSPLGRKLQAEFIRMFTTKDENPLHYVELLEQHKTHILEGTLYLNEIQITKSVSRPLGEYKQRVKNDGMDSAQAPYIRVAKILQQRGEEIVAGSKVSYVIVDSLEKPAKVIPSSDFTGEFDRCYLWEDLIYPPTYRLLVSAFPREEFGIDWDAWLTVRPRKEKLKRKIKQTEMFK